jgi:uncharacterized protein YkwD
VRIRELLTRALLAAAFASALNACGDGVGRPIVEPALASEIVSGAAGSMAGGGTGTGGTASTGGASGSDAGTSGVGPSVGFADGGANDFGPPQSAGFRNWGGPDPREPTAKGAVPASEYCEPVSDWDSRSDAAEQELIEYLNFTRELGVGCEREAQAAVPPLTVSPELRCSARLHSLDMSERGFFDQTNPDGVGPEERMRRAGFSFRVASESIARDEEGNQMGPNDESRYRALQQLFTDNGRDCDNLMDPRFETVGVGLYDGLWTLDFAGP